jgi:hypothetical protein
MNGEYEANESGSNFKARPINKKIMEKPAELPTIEKKAST